MCVCEYRRISNCEYVNRSITLENSFVQRRVPYSEDCVSVDKHALILIASKT